MANNKSDRLEKRMKDTFRDHPANLSTKISIIKIDQETGLEIIDDNIEPIEKSHHKALVEIEKKLGDFLSQITNK